MWQSAITKLTADATCGLMSDLIAATIETEYGHAWH